MFFVLLFFFKRTSVIAPSWNSYITKFFKSGRGKCIATMVTMQLKGQDPVYKPVSEFVGVYYNKRKHWSKQTLQLRGWVALSMN